MNVIAPVFVDLSSRVDMSSQFSSLIKLFESCIQIAETVKDENERMHGYIKELLVYEDSLLPALKDLVQKDNNLSLKEVVLWASQFFDHRKKVVVDMQQLLQKLPEDDRAAVVAEVDAWIAFKKKEREAKEKQQKLISNPPTQHKIPALLLKPFMDIVGPRFEEYTKKK